MTTTTTIERTTGGDLRDDGKDRVATSGAIVVETVHGPPTHRRGGDATTTTTNGGGLRADGKDRVATSGEIAETAAVEAENNVLDATTDEKPRSINRSPGESKSPRDTRRRNPY